jgi:hypothetical protein
MDDENMDVEATELCATAASYKDKQLVSPQSGPPSTPTSRSTCQATSTTLSPSKKKIHTRLSTELFGLGPAICRDDATITGIRLPTCLQVLRCMMFHCNAASQGERPGSIGAQARFTTAKGCAAASR